MRRSALVFAGIALTALTAFAGDGSVHRSAMHIPGRYIVVLDQSADTATVADAVRGLKGARVHHMYARGFKGLAVEMNDADAQALARDTRVQFVEEDAVVSAASTTPWGLDRIDQRSLPMDGIYMNDGTGAGVTVYVVDTGILATHTDFAGRVAAGFSAFADATGSSDCNGHGTHVAGIVGGTNYGVATAATLVPVRVLGCDGSGTTSTLLAGLDWVMQDHAANGTPAVVNMSLAGAASSAVDTEVNNVLAAGITVVVAAGNGNTDACGSSPARVSGAITVGASTEGDARASFSNYGGCVALFAPGTNIISDWNTDPAATAVSSGTSESSPFVAGVAALILEKFPTATPANVSQTVIANATLDALAGNTLPIGTANRLLFALISTLDDTAAAAQLLADPGFDYGSTFWTADICTVINQSGCPPDPTDPMFAMSVGSHSGKTHATIGGPAKSFHLSSEAETVPATAARMEIDFYLWVFTHGKKPSVTDTLNVEIRDASGALLQTVGTFTNLDSNSTYELKRISIDVNRYRGKAIRVAFSGNTAPGAPTYFLLDDVTLNVW